MTWVLTFAPAIFFKTGKFLSNDMKEEKSQNILNKNLVNAK